jgi:hypothetical protein
LSAAAKTIAPDAAAGKAWMEAQKDALKTGRAGAVLNALLPYCESLDVKDEQAPVRVCHRYLSARRDQLKYREALAEGLPIGSGEIESAHRYVAQKRLGGLLGRARLQTASGGQPQPAKRLDAGRGLTAQLWFAPRQLARVDLLILDDWGPEPLLAEQQRDLLEIVEDRYGSGSLIITSQVPIDRWYEIVGNPTLADAILDRIIHNAHRIELRGESPRKPRAGG